LLVQKLGMAWHTTYQNSAIDHVCIWRYNRSRFCTFLFFMQKLSRKSMVVLCESCRSFHNESNKIGFVLFSFFYDLLQILQDSAPSPRSRRDSFTNNVVWTSLGPLPRWVPGPTTRWAPGTTRLALHCTWWRGAQGLQRRSTRLGSCTCPAQYGRLLNVLD
jgi:hypothetical protein